ncbi:GL14438 [Drosophila persimilis]|uniref:GL14438 n=1 Tax=Drosophila persimilis TaxID=7234 RepID=B4GTW9_DROPE|nr:GL14438 [Drosophila persimilis]
MRYENANVNANKDRVNPEMLCQTYLVFYVQDEHLDVVIIEQDTDNDNDPPGFY